MLGFPEILLILLTLVIVPAVIVTVVIFVVRAVRKPGPSGGLPIAEASRAAMPSQPVESTATPTSTLQNCPRCGTRLAAGSAARGLCPKCLMEVGVGTRSGGDAENAGTPPAKAPTVAELAAHFPSLEILEVLGQGGMGMVYKARQRALDRLVALKVLPQDAARDPAFAERFQREARALARLSHPNIVGVHEFGETAGYFYLVMEYVDGADLRRVLQERRLSAAEALRIVPAICDALQYAHANGVVHRDIKPGNILMDREGRVKIADFGIAKLVGGESPDPTLTQLRQRMGTPHYMAPEQVENPQTVDHRADIFSLGVVFYEMLTGELPLGRFPAPSTRVQVDVRLDEVVLRTLEKEPSRRYQQAGEVKTEVERISANPGGQSSLKNRESWWHLPEVKKAVAGLIWAAILFPIFVLALFVFGRGGGGGSESPGKVLVLGMVVICGLAPVGTTVLGWLATRDALRERRGGAALGLALLTRGLFPGLLLVLLVFAFWLFLVGLVFGGMGHVLVPALALVACLATGIPLLVWLTRRTWRWANHQLGVGRVGDSTNVRRGPDGWSAAMIASQVVVCFLLIGWLAASTGRRPSQAPVVDPFTGVAVDPQTGLPLATSLTPPPIWELTTNGPVLTDSVGWSMPGGLTGDQKVALERALQITWLRYEQSLAERVAIRTNASDHIEVEVTLDARELAKMESGFWAQVDLVFNRAQQIYLREILPIVRETVPVEPQAVGSQGTRRPGLSLPMATRPILPTAPLLALNGNLVLEFWQVGSWYHWRLRSGTFDDGGTMDGVPVSRDPEMPPEYYPLIKIARVIGGTAKSE